MSLEKQALDLAIQMGKDVAAMKESLGNLDDLNTTNKSSIAAAIEEINQELNSALTLDNTPT